MEVLLRHFITSFDYIDQILDDDSIHCKNSLFCNNCGGYMRTCKVNHSSCIYCNCRKDLDMCLENAFYWHRHGMELVFFEILKQEYDPEYVNENDVEERQNVFEYMMREEEMQMRKPPKYVQDIIIKDFISKGNMCPIAFEELTEETAALTSCYHVFNKNMVLEWVIQHKTCPSCRKECVVWGASSTNV